MITQATLKTGQKITVIIFDDILILSGFHQEFIDNFIFVRYVFIQEIYDFLDQMTKKNIFFLECKGNLSEKCSYSFFKKINQNPHMTKPNLITFKNCTPYVTQPVLMVSNALDGEDPTQFYHAYSKGIISSYFGNNIYLIDMRYLPYSKNSLIYSEDFTPMLILLEPIKIKNTTNCILLGYSLSALFNHFYCATPKLLPHSLKEVKDPLKEASKSIFMICINNTYGTAFYLGDNIFVTSKHIITQNPKNSLIKLTNHHYQEFQCKEIENLKSDKLDIAFVEAIDREKVLEIPELNQSKEKVKKSTPVQVYQYSIFQSHPMVTMGVVSNISFHHGVQYVYHISSACFGGASGAPVLDMEFGFVGMVIENTTICSVTYPEISFAYSKEIINIRKNVNYLFEEVSDIHKAKLD